MKILRYQGCTMNEIYYIGERPSPRNMHAGSKERIDVDIILEKKRLS